MEKRNLVSLGFIAIGTTLMVKGIRDLSYRDGYIDGAVDLADEIVVGMEKWKENELSRKRSRDYKSSYGVYKS